MQKIKVYKMTELAEKESEVNALLDEGYKITDKSTSDGNIVFYLNKEDKKDPTKEFKSFIELLFDSVNKCCE